ncbi:hypothetical protein FVER53590_02857 [Fusarium verticillioides]|nr:hypothetical protein FVER53590_02857 [Fusarium verticillioides]
MDSAGTLDTLFLPPDIITKVLLRYSNQSAGLQRLGLNFDPPLFRASVILRTIPGYHKILRHVSSIGNAKSTVLLTGIAISGYRLHIMTTQDWSVDDVLIGKVTNYVEEYMSKYDASHDFNHIKRVLRLSQHIQSRTPSTRQDLVTLAALLHDVGDKKYLRPGEDPSRMVASVLVSFGAPQALADTVQAICLGVSYSSEVKDPARTQALVGKYPELAVVQDADRLDAIGAVGIARTFAFGGAKSRTLENTMEHFDDKLLLLEGMMKTEEGRRMAKERTERLRLMKAWWQEETSE